MTTSLLTLLVLIELARLVLQYRSGKTYVERQEKTYCMASEVELREVLAKDKELQSELNRMAAFGYEIASVVYVGFNDTDLCHYYSLFFTRKKIKNFSE